MSQEPDILDTLSRSIAPSIYGHEYIKKALILQAVGGEQAFPPLCLSAVTSTSCSP